MSVRLFWGQWMRPCAARAPRSFQMLTPSSYGMTQPGRRSRERSWAQANAPNSQNGIFSSVTQSSEAMIPETHRNQLAEILREVNGEVRDLVHTGLSMFHIYTRPEIAPIFATDPGSGQGDQDFLQCTLARRTDAEMWRVSIDGKATIIREYWEDNANDNVRLGSTPGSWFSPNITTRVLAELLRHARGLAERFNVPTAVSFRCEWLGLHGL